MPDNKNYQTDIKSRKKILKPISNDVDLTSLPQPLDISKQSESSSNPEKSHDFMKKNAAYYAPELLWEFFSDDQPSKNE